MWLLCSFQGPWRGDSAGRLGAVVRTLARVCAPAGERRSLKTQQHAGVVKTTPRVVPQVVKGPVADTPRQPGSVDMLGPAARLPPGRRPLLDERGRLTAVATGAP
jgi:hypothetical protein